MGPSDSGRRNLWQQLPRLAGQVVRIIASETAGYQELVNIREQVEVLEGANKDDAAELEMLDQQLKRWRKDPPPDDEVLRDSLTQVDRLGARMAEREAELANHARQVTKLSADLQRRQQRLQAENVWRLVSVEYNVVSSLRHQAETLEQQIKALQVECQAQQRKLSDRVESIGLNILSSAIYATLPWLYLVLTKAMPAAPDTALAQPSPEPVPTPAEEIAAPKKTATPEAPRGSLSRMSGSMVEFEWVRIPAGAILMGSDKIRDNMARDDELPQHTLYLLEYHIARVPVTNAQYKRFVDATNHRAPSYWADGRIPNGKENHPVVHVTWRDAMAFCQWAGVRLPTEAEWEKAARGADGRIYPWGNEPPNRERCNFRGNENGTTMVGSYPPGANGLYDMAGNVWEWTSSKYRAYPYEGNDGREDRVGDGARTLRGGSWLNLELDVRCAARNFYNPNGLDTLGFRVVESSPGF